MRANCKRQVTIDDGCVPVTALVIGMMDNNCFIVADGREQGAPAMVIDPAGDAEAIQKALGWFKLETIVSLTTTTTIWLPCLSWRRPPAQRLFPATPIAASSKRASRATSATGMLWHPCMSIARSTTATSISSARSSSRSCYPGPHEGRHLPLPSRL